jgi:hypothetical protein
MVFTVSFRKPTQPFDSKKYLGGCISSGSQSALVPLNPNNGFFLRR